MYTINWFCGTQDLTDAFAIRQEVFVDEQEFAEEFDEDDKICYHIVIYEAQSPLATGRLLLQSDEAHTYRLGRIAVRKPHRGKKLGALLVAEMEKKVVELGGTRTILGAQRRAQGFYETLGYCPYGKEYFEEYCPHIHMSKELEAVR